MLAVCKAQWVCRAYRVGCIPGLYGKHHQFGFVGRRGLIGFAGVSEIYPEVHGSF